MSPRNLSTTIALCLALVPPLISGGPASADPPIPRIDAQETRTLVASGEALLICAYDDGYCRTRLLDGALFLGQLDGMLDKLPMNQMLIFYCE